MTKGSILIVEDEAILAADLSERLERSGYQVVETVSSGQQALSIIDSTPPDLVLLDIKIQGVIDGIETAEIIRSTSKIPIIYLTAFSNESLLERAKTTEPYGYLVKPVTDSQLLSVLEIAFYKAKVEADRAQQLKDSELVPAGMKILDGILPVCSFCKDIRGEDGQWEAIESYIQKRSNASFSHGICPKCADKHYPGIDLYGR